MTERSLLATQVGLVIEKMPPLVLERVYAHVSKYSWGGSFLADDTLASKRVYPDSVFKYAKKVMGH